MTEPADLVFVGGTGRSGTTVLSHLLGRHSRFRAVPIECRFHCNPKGLADVVGGRATVDEFLRKLRTYWWYRVRIGSRALVPVGVVGRARVAANRLRWRLRPRRGGAEPRVRGLHEIVAPRPLRGSGREVRGELLDSDDVSRRRATSSSTCSRPLPPRPESRPWSR